MLAKSPFISHADKKRAGSAVVEFAMVVPLFFAFIFGIIELGRGLMVHDLLTRAARIGCRQGILPSTMSNDDIKKAVETALANQGVANATVAVKVNGSTGNIGSAQTRNEVTVEVTAPAPINSWLPKNTYLTGNLRAVFVLQRE